MAWWRWWVNWLDLGNEDRDPIDRAALDYAELLEREAPELEVELQEDGTLHLSRGDEEDPIVMNLPRMAARIPHELDAEGRQEIYASWLETLRQVLEESEPDPSWQDRLLMWLVTPTWVDARAQDSRVVCFPVPGLDLFAALVFDFPSSVRYVLRDDLARMGLTAEQARAIAMRRLRERVPDGLVREQLDDPEVRAYHAMDSYEAARILVLPDLLEPGEALGVVIPHRDVLMFFPLDLGPEFARELADTDNPDALLDCGVCVTVDGFSVLDPAD